LATLEYKTQEEILLVIYRIQPILAEQGQTLLEYIDNFNEKHGAYGILSDKGNIYKNLIHIPLYISIF